MATTFAVEEKYGGTDTILPDEVVDAVVEQGVLSEDHHETVRQYLYELTTELFTGTSKLAGDDDADVGGGIGVTVNPGEAFSVRYTRYNGRKYKLAGRAGSQLMLPKQEATEMDAEIYLFGRRIGEESLDENTEVNVGVKPYYAGVRERPDGIELDLVTRPHKYVEGGWINEPVQAVLFRNDDGSFDIIGSSSYGTDVKVGDELREWGSAKARGMWGEMKAGIKGELCDWHVI